MTIEASDKVSFLKNRDTATAKLKKLGVKKDDYSKYISEAGKQGWKLDLTELPATPKKVIKLEVPSCEFHPSVPLAFGDLKKPEILAAVKEYEPAALKDFLSTGVCHVCEAEAVEVKTRSEVSRAKTQEHLDLAGASAKPKAKKEPRAASTGGARKPSAASEILRLLQLNKTNEEVRAEAAESFPELLAEERKGHVAWYRNHYLKLSKLVKNADGTYSAPATK